MFLCVYVCFSVRGPLGRGVGDIPDGLGAVAQPRRVLLFLLAGWRTLSSLAYFPAGN